MKRNVTLIVLFTILSITGIVGFAEEDFTYENVDNVVKTVIISENVTEISAYEFSEYTELETVYYNAIECTKIGAYDYKGDYIGIFDNCL